MCVSTAATSCAASSLLTLSDSSELVLSYRFCQLDLVAFEFESKALSCWVANRIGRASTRGCVLSLRAWPLRSTHALRRRAGERETASLFPQISSCVSRACLGKSRSLFMSTLRKASLVGFAGTATWSAATTVRCSTANCTIIGHFSAFKSGLVAPFLYAA
jgi:hypothetical protein